MQRESRSLRIFYKILKILVFVLRPLLELWEEEEEEENVVVVDIKYFFILL